MYAHAHAPVRIEIAGGGTDLPAWTSTRRGLCLNLAIDTYCHAVAITRPDRQVVASYSQLERATAATEIANGLIREAAILHGWVEGFEVHTLSEITSRGSGLGVSSAIAVCLTSVFRRMERLSRGVLDVLDEPLDDPLDVARRAWTVEIDRLGYPIGRQDSMAVAHGGLKIYAFERDQASVVRSFSYDDAVWVAKHLLLLRLQDGHDSRSLLRGLASPEPFEKSYAAVDVAVRGIDGKDPGLLGKALSMVYETKQAYGGVTQRISSIVDGLQDPGRGGAKIAGVHGCTVTGAGGGGHLVVACDQEARESVIRATDLPEVRVAPDLLGVRSEGWR